MAVLGFCGRLGFSLVAESRGYSLVEVRRLFIVVASLVEEHGLGGFSSVVLRLQGTGSILVAHGLGCSVASGVFLEQIEPKSSGLAGRFFTTELPGKPNFCFFCLKSNNIFFSSFTYHLLLWSLLLQIKIRFLINNSNNNTTMPVSPF